MGGQALEISYDASMKFGLLILATLVLFSCTKIKKDLNSLSRTTFKLESHSMQVALPRGWTGNDKTFGAGVVIRGEDLKGQHSTVVFEKAPPEKQNEVKQTYLQSRLQILKEAGATEVQSDAFAPMSDAQTPTETADVSYSIKETRFAERIYLVSCPTFVLRAQAMIPQNLEDIARADDLIRSLTCK